MSKPCPFSFYAVSFDKYLDDEAFVTFLGVFQDAVSNNELFQALCMITKPLSRYYFLRFQHIKLVFNEIYHFLYAQIRFAFVLLHTGWQCDLSSVQNYSVSRPIIIPYDMQYHMQHIMISRRTSPARPGHSSLFLRKDNIASRNLDCPRPQRPGSVNKSHMYFKLSWYV